MKSLVEFQKKFDKDHGWSTENLTPEQKIEELKFLAIALTGEVGEIAEPLKKFLRKRAAFGSNEKELEVLFEALKEEVIDVLIYTIKLATLLGFDIEAEFYKKSEKNAKKFQVFRDRFSKTE